jgi:hypothetical protein
LHLLGLRWHAGSGLGGLLLRRLGATGMMLLVLLLGFDTSAQRQS